MLHIFPCVFLPSVNFVCVKCLFKSFPNVFNGLFVCVWSCNKSSLHTLDINPTWGMSCKYFLPAYSLHFYFFNSVFSSAKFLILWNLNYWFFLSFSVHAFVSDLKNSLPSPRSLRFPYVFSWNFYNIGSQIISQFNFCLWCEVDTT